MTLTYRPATTADLDLLARLNAGLQQDEGNRLRLDEAALRQRMADWLSRGEYQAVLAERDGHPLGYGLYRLEDAAIFLRHFYIAPEVRCRGLGRAFYRYLRESLWPRDWPVQLNVLAGNRTGQAFWASLGFEAYCLTLQQPPPAAH